MSLTIKAKATKLGIQVKDIFFAPGGPHDAAIVIEAEGSEPIITYFETAIVVDKLAQRTIEDSAS